MNPKEQENAIETVQAAKAATRKMVIWWNAA